ncbi:MAG: hypothetical protein JSV00_04785 [bacterium]|nr:MAG: hypothetical protein JSV00_04785 [bacterium]
MTRDEAVCYIRDTLRCGCPDEILGALSIETRDKPDLCLDLIARSFPTLLDLVDRVLVVGGRLLVLECGNLTRSHLEEVLTASPGIRAKLNLRRVRVVVSASGTSAQSGPGPWHLPDDRVHLHFIERSGGTPD